MCVSVCARAVPKEKLECRAGMREAGPYKGHCYVVPPRTMAFDDADFYCRKTYGGRLASMENAEELEFAIQTIRDHG